MNSPRLRLPLLIACSLALALPLQAAESGRVQLLRVPDGGIQPQAAVDARGVVHLIYFKGEAKAGDLFYVRQEPGQATFSWPIQVNSQPASAIAVGTIRGAQLALGRNGRVHVAWNGAKSRPDAKYRGVPMWYARLNDAAGAFEPQRDMITSVGGLDGGGAVAADGDGNVYVLWHGSAPNSPGGEVNRAVFAVRSTDDGQSFGPERQANPTPTGACGCCGMRAFADQEGNLFALYRAATALVNRDEVLLVSRDRGATYAMAHVDPWNVASCPMSSASLAAARAGIVAAWETAGQVYFATASGKSLEVGKPIAPPGAAKRKHPVAAVNPAGTVLLAWTEGTGWQRGGAVAWQLFDSKGKPLGEGGRLADGVPVWSLVAAVARGDGSFTILH